MLCGRSAVVCGEDINTEPEVTGLRGFVMTAWTVTYVCEGYVSHDKIF